MVVNIRSAEFRENPYAIYRRLRAEAPVCAMEPGNHWLVSRHADVTAILRNPALFSSAVVTTDPGEGAQFLLHARTLIGNDPPQHTRLRGLISRAFTPAMVNAQADGIRLVVRDLLEKIKLKGTFDLVRDFAMPLPIIVIAQMLGIDPSRREEFKRWSDLLITWRKAPSIEAVEKDVQQMYDYFTSVIEERRRYPREDLISALVLACDDKQTLTSQEVLGLARLLLVAGNETTTNLLGNTVMALLAFPDQWKKVQADRSLIPNMVEESLRFNSPAQCLTRVAMADTEICGVKIAKGEIVLPLLASANHDELLFSESEKFDVRRNAKGHLSFGVGIHFCLGSPLARLQARIAFEELFASVTALERIDAKPLTWIDSFFFRGVRELGLRFHQ